MRWTASSTRTLGRSTVLAEVHVEFNQFEPIQDCYDAPSVVDSMELGGFMQVYWYLTAVGKSAQRTPLVSILAMSIEEPSTPFAPITYAKKAMTIEGSHLTVISPRSRATTE